VKKQSLAEGCCAPVDNTRPSLSRLYFNQFSVCACVLNIEVSCLSPRSIKLCDGYSLATRTLQTTHLPILPLTAILYVAAREQPDVTSRQLNSLALVCNWYISILYSGKLSNGLIFFIFVVHILHEASRYERKLSDHIFVVVCVCSLGPLASRVPCSFLVEAMARRFYIYKGI